MKRGSIGFGQRVLVSVTVVLFIASGALAVWNIQLRTNQKTMSVEQRDRAAYPLLSNRIFADNPNDAILNLAPLRSELRDYFSTLDSEYSFYAEYLPTGTSIKINQDSPMIAASLLKVPVVMNLFYAAENGKVNLSDKAKM